MSRRAALLVCVLFAVGCGGGGESSGPPPVNVASVSVTPSSGSINVGATFQLSATAHDAAGTTISGRTFLWTSSATSIATVDQNGLVTGVTAGTATITASTASRSGTATVTVNLDPVAATSITLQSFTTNGQAVNVNNVAGTIQANLVVTLPSGFVGTLTLKSDGTVLSQDTVVSGSAIAGARLAAPAAPGLITVTGSSQVIVDVKTAEITTNFNNQILQLTPRMLNGSHLLDLTLAGTVGSVNITKSTQSTITTLNPSVFLGLRKHAVLSAPAVLVPNGQPTVIGSGNLDLVIAHANFDPTATLTGYDLSIGNFSTTYGDLSANPAVYSLHVTPSNFGKALTITPTVLAAESPTVGSAIRITGIQLNIGTQTPWNNIGLQGNCADFDLDGFADAVAGTRSGCNRFAQITTLNPALVGQGWQPIDGKMFFDNLAPRTQNGAFTLIDHTYTPGQPFFDSWGSTCCQNNFIGNTYSPGWGLNYANITDLGIDKSKTEFYIAPSINSTQLFSLQYRWNGNSALTETGTNRSYVAGARVYDYGLNAKDIRLTTSLRNAFKLGGGLSTNYGVDDAIFGFNRTGGSVQFSSTGYTNRVISTQTINVNAGFTYAASTPNVTIPDNWLGYWATFQDGTGTTCLYGSGTNCDQYETRTATGGTVTATAFIGAPELVNRATQLRGAGQWNGYYQVGYAGSTVDGNPLTTSNNRYTSTFLWDYNKPTVTATPVGSVTPEQPATYNATPLDNLDLDRLYYGIAIDLPHPLFELGFPYTFFGYNDIGDGFGKNLVRSSPQTIQYPILPGGLFFSRTDGSMDPTFYRTKGVVFQSKDEAHLYSVVSMVTFANLLTYVLPSYINYFLFFGPSSACTAMTCSNGALPLAHFVIRVKGPGTTLPVSKVIMNALVQTNPTSGQVRLLGSATTPVSVSTVNGITTWDFDVTKDFTYWYDNVLPILLFASALSADGKVLFKTQFFTFNLYAN